MQSSILLFSSGGRTGQYHQPCGQQFRSAAKREVGKAHTPATKKAPCVTIIVTQGAKIIKMKL